MERKEDDSLASSSCQTKKRREREKSFKRVFYLWRISVFSQENISAISLSLLKRVKYAENIAHRSEEILWERGVGLSRTKLTMKGGELRGVIFLPFRSVHTEGEIVFGNKCHGLSVFDDNVSVRTTHTPLDGKAMTREKTPQERRKKRYSQEKRVLTF